MIGEERPIQPFVDRVQQWECDAECNRERSELRPGLRRQCRCGLCEGAVEFRESLARIQGLRHDPTPRKSLATWPTTKAYHTVKARKTVTHLRTLSCSEDR